MLPADIGFVADTLEDIDVDEETIKKIVKILEDNADDLKSGQPGAPAAATLGASDKGALLAFHTKLAHQKVVEAMEQMVVGLRGYAADIHQFHKEITFTDDTASVASGVVNGQVNGVKPTVFGSTSCTSAPDFHTNTQCTIPTGGN